MTPGATLHSIPNNSSRVCTQISNRIFRTFNISASFKVIRADVRPKRCCTRCDVIVQASSATLQRPFSPEDNCISSLLMAPFCSAPVVYFYTSTGVLSQLFGK